MTMKGQRPQTTTQKSILAPCVIVMSSVNMWNHCKLHLCLTEEVNNVRIHTCMLSKRSAIISWCLYMHTHLDVAHIVICRAGKYMHSQEPWSRGEDRLDNLHHPVCHFFLRAHELSHSKIVMLLKSECSTVVTNRYITCVVLPLASSLKELGSSEFGATPGSISIAVWELVSIPECRETVSPPANAWKKELVTTLLGYTYVHCRSQFTDRYIQYNIFYILSYRKFFF